MPISTFTDDSDNLAWFKFLESTNGGGVNGSSPESA